MDSLVPAHGTIVPPAGLTAPLSPIELLLADKRSPATKRAYRADLCDFFCAKGDPDPGTVRAFLALSPPEVALRLATYKADLMARGMAEATINRRLAAVRSLLKMSHRLGLASTDGRGLVDGEKVRSYRDTRGIDVKAMRKLLALPNSATLRGKRDSALLRLLLENALRRAEVCALGVVDFDPEGRRLMILGKGRGSQKAPVTISSRTAGAIMGYLLAAGHTDGALFRNVSRDPATRGDGLTADGLYQLIQGYGHKLGLNRLTPHQLRHSAVTLALDATKGDVRRVQKLSRHARIETLMVYDDNRTDHAGDIVNMLSKLL